jgi:ABC-2 type transport system permease protein
MTTTLTAAPDAAYRVTFGRVVRSEWTKLRSLRSAWITLTATAVVSIGLATVFGWVYNNLIDDGEIEPSVTEAIDMAFLAMDLPALVLGILGVLQMSGEYGTGSIRATLTAVPRRVPVLWAKGLALVAAVLPVVAAIALASFVLSQSFAGSDGSALSDPGVPRSILGVTGYVVGMALIGLAIGALLRSTAAAITVFVVAHLVIPGLLVAMPDVIQDSVGPYLPILAANAMYTQENSGAGPELLSPGAGGVVLLAWICVSFAAGAYVLQRRDA